MGFLDRFLGNKEPEVRVEKISFSELDKWVAARKEELGSGLGEDVEKLRGEALDALNELGKRLDVLKDAEMEKDVQQRIKSIVASSRDNYVSKLKKISSRIDVEAKPLKLSDEIDQGLAEMKKTDLKYGERVNFGFSDELKKVKKELNRLVETSNKLNKLLEDRKRKTTALRAVEREMKNIEEAKKDMEKLQKRSHDISNGLGETEKAKKDNEKGVDDIENSDRAEKLGGIKKELEELNAKKQELETLVLNILGPLKRVFKKFARAISEGKASGINVGKYAEDPVGTYFWGEHTLPDLLAKMQKAIQTGVLDMDSAERDKAVKKIRGISFAHLEKTRSDYNTVTSRIRSLELNRKELDIHREVDKLHREAESLDDRITSESKKLGRVESEIEEQKVKIIELNRKLESKLSDFSGGRAELI